MGFKAKVRYFMNGANNHSHIYKILESKEYINERYYGELIRNVHSIEKGLSLSETRLGFGYKKIFEAFDIAKKLSQIDSEKYNEAITMFADAVKMYLDFHKENEYSDENILEIQRLFDRNLKERISSDFNFGGMKLIKNHICSPDEKAIIDALFLNRHSVREFTGESIEPERLLKAIELAHHCPSACNRQGYRVHVIDKKDFSVFENWFDGMRIRLRINLNLDPIEAI